MGKKVGRPQILTEAQLSRIRKAKRVRGRLTNKALAHHYGVSESTIGGVK